MRFDDALHVDPASIELRLEALVLTAWQTKVDRGRRGTRLAVPNVSVSRQPWLESGWRIYQTSCDGVGAAISSFTS